MMILSEVLKVIKIIKQKDAAIARLMMKWYLMASESKEEIKVFQYQDFISDKIIQNADEKTLQAWDGIIDAATAMSYWKMRDKERYHRSMASLYMTGHETLANEIAQVTHA